MTIDPPGGAQVTDLPARLDTDAAGKLLETLHAARGKALTLNGSAVTFLGGKCLLTLLAARIAWDEDGQPFVLKEPSEAMTQGAAELGTDLTTMCQETPCN